MVRIGCCWVLSVVMMVIVGHQIVIGVINIINILVARNLWRWWWRWGCRYHYQVVVIVVWDRNATCGRVSTTTTTTTIAHIVSINLMLIITRMVMQSRSDRWWRCRQQVSGVWLIAARAALLAAAGIVIRRQAENVTDLERAGRPLLLLHAIQQSANKVQ